MATISDAFLFIRNGANIKQEKGKAGYPITRIETISSRDIDRDKLGYADIYELSKYEDFILQDYDILMSHINSVSHLGKSAIYRKQNDEVIIHGMNLLCLRANQEFVFPPYASYYFGSDSFIHQIHKITKPSVNQASFTVTELKKIRIPLPDLPTQRRIAATLDKVSEGITVCKQMLTDLDLLVKSQFVEMFGGITEFVPLSFYIAALTAGKSLAGEEECTNKVLKTGAVTYDYFDPSQVKNLPKEYTPMQEHQIHDGDVLVSRMNTLELVGACAYVFHAPDNTYLPDRLWRAELREQVDPIFVWQIMIQETTKNEMRKIAGGTSGSMKNISKIGLLGIQVPRVSIELQQQFAYFIRQADKSKFVIQQQLTELETLKKSLMQQYFG